MHRLHEVACQRESSEAKASNLWGKRGSCHECSQSSAQCKSVAGACRAHENEKTKMKEVCRVEPGNFARNMMPCASLHSSILENTGEARGGSPPIMEQPVKRAG